MENASTATGSKPVGNPQPLPQTSRDIVQQAYESCCEAWEKRGIRRQTIELVLPLIGATGESTIHLMFLIKVTDCIDQWLTTLSFVVTDLDDWPGGIRQQFKAAAPMVESLLKQLKVLPGLEGPLKAELWDEADAVGAWVGQNIALILFPTAETLPRIRALTEDKSCPNRLIILVNPQWTTGRGQVISDFGIFPWQQKNSKDFISSFQNTYTVQNQRLSGDYCTWLYTYPQGWQINVVTGPGQWKCILQSPEERPSYQQVQSLLRSLPWTMSSKGLADRIMAEAEFNRKTAQRPPSGPS